MFPLSVWPRCCKEEQQQREATASELQEELLPFRRLLWGPHGGPPAASPWPTTCRQQAVAPGVDPPASPGRWLLAVPSWHCSVCVTQSLSAEPRGQKFCV